MRAIQETRFEYKGYPCVVLFMPMGYRCGYVGLTEGNQYYYVDYDDIPIDCHGGLTYSDNRLFGQDDEHVWWIGYDCGHCFDGYDLEKMEKYFGDDKEFVQMFRYTKEYKIRQAEEYGFRTLEYCINECKSIVDQILGDEV